MSNTKKYKDCLDALIYYCNYRERSPGEVQQKLKDFDIAEEDKEKIFEELKDLSILDEKRYIEAFISGKTRIKRWGKNKIRAALAQKKVDPVLLKEALNNHIDMDEYLASLDHLFMHKWELLKRDQSYATRQKLYRYLQGKGYESEWINACFDRFFSA
jgi:regulatory protein